MSESPRITVAEIQLEPVVRVSPAATVREVARILTATRVATVIVDTLPPSEITDRDVVRALAAGVPADASIEEAVREEPLFVHRQIRVDRVLDVMLREQRHAVVVVDDNNSVVGLLTLAVAITALVDGPPWLGALRVALRIDGGAP
jgi:CBS domain-containing protein